jgi:hypothetical protein
LSEANDMLVRVLTHPPYKPDSATFLTHNTNIAVKIKSSTMYVNYLAANPISAQPGMLSAELLRYRFASSFSYLSSAFQAACVYGLRHLHNILQ